MPHYIEDKENQIVDVYALSYKQAIQYVRDNLEHFEVKVSPNLSSVETKSTSNFYGRYRFYNKRSWKGD